MSRIIIALSLVLAIAVPLSADDKDPNKLSYNDGSADGKKSIGGSGPMIRFSLPQPQRTISGIRIHGARYGLPQAPDEQFLIYFLNEDRTKVVATEMADYATFDRGENKWETVRFETPVAVPEKFWIALDFRAHRTKGVYVSYDTSSDGKHSYAGLPGLKAAPADAGGDWMIEALLSGE